LETRKKILSILIKILIGVASFTLIYIRLKNEFTTENVGIITSIIFSVRSFIFLIIALFLVPLNWGIESFKWKLITAPIEKINIYTAMKSVYSGVCLGNLAPGRSTEFIAKIFFFEPHNRSKITVLHFVNGLIQFSITVLIGLIALSFKINTFKEKYEWIIYVMVIGGCAIILLLVLSLYNISFILNFISKKFSKKVELKYFDYTFNLKIIIQLFSLSILRYLVFFSQLSILIYLFSSGEFSFSIFIGITIYFLITSVVPMISVLEVAIRAAIALVVFKDCGVSNTNLALAIVMLWLLNIVLPSIIGYAILVKQNFNFKISKEFKKK
jgi:hypothetical protein